MNISALDLNLIAIFDAIYEERNISKAARKVGLSQPAVSSALQRLRDYCGDPLFVRTRNGMIPTRRAEELATPIRNSLTALGEALHRKPDFSPLHCDRTFRIATGEWFSLYLLPKMSAHLQIVAPNVNLAILPLVPHKAHESLKSGEVDLVISALPLKEAGLYRSKIGEGKFACAVCKSHPEIRNRITIKQFVKYPHVLYSMEGKGPGTVDTALAKLGLQRRIAFRLAHVLAIPHILRDTSLIATLPLPLVRTFAKFLDIVCLTPPLDLPPYDILQYWDKPLHNDAAHAWLRTTVKEIYQDLGRSRKIGR